MNDLPTWASAIAPGKIEINAEQFYPDLLNQLWADENWQESGVCKGLQRGEIDQYWLEVAFQCAKLDIKNAVNGSELSPQKGGALLIMVKDDTKADSGISRYAMASYKKGKNINYRAIYKEAREHYKRIRNILI